MIWIWAFFGFLLLLDGLRIRGRAQSIPALAPSDEPVSPEHRFLVAPGVTLDEATRRAASAHARAKGLEVVDLMPRGLWAVHVWSLFQIFDPNTYRKDRLARGVSLGHATLVHADVLERARVSAEPPKDALSLVRTVGDLKRYACDKTDLAIAPALAAHEDTKHRLTMLREIAGDGANVLLVGSPLGVALVTIAGITGDIPGWIALGAFHLQILIAFAGVRLGVGGVLISALFRPLLELWGWLALLFEKTPPPRTADHKEREKYGALMKAGTESFFEPRMERCPICDSPELVTHMKTGDLLQHKPGTFSLERCKACAHIFQNPRLSIEGLNFYYSDFYDGLGGDGLDRIFGSSGPLYQKRAALVREALGKDEKPARWLDVGGGHGHFCCAARQDWPGTQFDALDLSESVEDAVRRGWVDEGFRGLFPEMAPKMSASYDVVSMSHYLEHTREPAAEIDAAAVALKPGGLLLVEVPDPECPMRHLGRLWLPHFQPQHQHLLSVKNLERILVERGFAPLVWHRGEAHIRVDCLAAVILFLNWIAPAGDVPWRPASRAARAWRTIAFIFAIPWLVVARIADEIIGVIVERTRGSNAYRVLARKNEAPAAALSAG